MVNKVAVITGAGSGVGRAAARALTGAGWSVVFAGRRKETLDEAAAGHAQALVVPTDVTIPAQVTALFASAKQKFGRVDLLFNNAGMFGPKKAFEDLGDDDIDAVIRTNLSGCFYCAREAFRVMKAQDPQGGRIINNGSISATTPRPNSALYTSTKHAITGLTKTLALDGRKYDIACGQIDIGNTRTEMMAQTVTGMAQANGTTMVEPTMDLKNVSDAVLYMAGLPADANVLFLTVMATKMPFVGRG
ncbi:MAG: SDR family oxidoreductase [Rhodospirillaceae bacterium]|nr:SDR family oxidoreductase [Rhodospirillaceae bacterium]